MKLVNPKARALFLGHKVLIPSYEVIRIILGLCWFYLTCNVQPFTGFPISLKDIVFNYCYSLLVCFYSSHFNQQYSSSRFFRVRRSSHFSFNNLHFKQQSKQYAELSENLRTDYDAYHYKIGSDVASHNTLHVYNEVYKLCTQNCYK